MDYEPVQYLVVDGFKNFGTPLRDGDDEIPRHSIRLEVERAEQVGRTVTQVIPDAALGVAGTHGQQRLAAVQGLEPGFFIHPQDQHLLWRIEIQARDGARLLDGQSLGKPQVLHLVRPHREGPSDTADGSVPAGQQEKRCSSHFYRNFLQELGEERCSLKETEIPSVV